jgi:hypothetical protein
MVNARGKSCSRKRAVLGILGMVGFSLLYLGYVALSSLFAILLFSFWMMFPSSRWYNRASNGHRFFGTEGMIIVDAMRAFLAYLCADFLRCMLWMKTDWPEVVEGYGSTLSIHAKMAAFILLLWPFILYCLGWYKCRWRPLHWKIICTVAALAILALSMSAVSLLLERELYPRAQLGFVAVTLPLITILTRSIWELVRHVRSGAPPGVRNEY